MNSDFQEYLIETVTLDDVRKDFYSWINYLISEHKMLLDYVIVINKMN